VFSLRTIKKLLGQYTLVQLYTDVVPERFQPTTSPEENKEFQREVFKTAQLPLYVIVKPTGAGKFQEVDRYDEGKINDVARFTEFLQGPLEAKQLANRPQAAGLP
jgi:hypothetical protein